MSRFLTINLYLNFLNNINYFLNLFKYQSIILVFCKKIIGFFSSMEYDCVSILDNSSIVFYNCDSHHICVSILWICRYFDHAFTHFK